MNNDNTVHCKYCVYISVNAILSCKTEEEFNGSSKAMDCEQTLRLIITCIQ